MSKFLNSLTPKLLIIALLLGLSSCGDSQHEYTVRTCYLIFDNATHQDITLASAMNANTPGTFCRITRSMKNGAMCFDFANNAGQTSSKVANGVDQRRTVILGFNEGIIVGYGNLDFPAIFYAFDNECPNCFDPDALPVRSKPLSMSANGIATCASCQRQYNMNNGGVICNGDGGKKMTRYHATCTGPFGTLAVN